METENAIFQDLESFGKKRSFQNGYGKVLDFCLERFYKHPKWMKRSVVLKTLYVMFAHFTICNTNHNQPKTHKINRVPLQLEKQEMLDRLENEPFQDLAGKASTP